MSERFKRLLTLIGIGVQKWAAIDPVEKCLWDVARIMVVQKAMCERDHRHLKNKDKKDVK
jgi:hypothetical protein